MPSPRTTKAGTEVTSARVENIATNSQHSYWNGEAAITGAITTITSKLYVIPANYEITQLTGKDGVGAYGATVIKVIPVITHVDIVAPNQLRVYSILGVTDSTGAYPVPGGAGTAMLYYCYADFLTAGFTITTAPKVRYSINLKPEV
jgi:hypothetical protein